MKEKKKSSPIRKIVASLCALILVVCIVFTLIFTLDLGYLLPLIGSAPAPFSSGEQMRALTIKSHSGGVTPDELAAYYDTEIQKARMYGINTIIYEAKTDITVLWRDSVFPVADEISAQDSLFEKVDPLNILCTKLEGKGIQLWLKIDAYSTSGYSAEQKGRVPKLVKTLGGTGVTRVSADNQDYAKLLANSISRLPHKYPVAGIMLCGLDKSAEINTDAALWGVKFVETMAEIETFWRKHNFATKMAISFNGAITDNSENTYMTPELISSLFNNNMVDYIVPNIEGGQDYKQSLKSWGESSKFIFSQSGYISQTALFAAALDTNCAGAIFSPADTGELSHTLLQLYVNMLNPAGGEALPEAFVVPQTLQINFPSNNEKIYATQVFVMGNSNPAAPLYCNDAEVTVRAANGSFGLLVNLEYGDNVFNFTQEGQSTSVTIVRPEPSGGGGGTIEYPEDDSKEAEKGQAIKVTKTISSLVADYMDIDTIKETVRKGATAIVEESFQRVFNGKKTWFYKITSGDYIWAQNCEWVDSAVNNFTGLTSTADEKGEMLSFAGSGTPAIYTKHENGKLRVIMYDTSFELGGGFASGMINSASIEKGDNSVTITLDIPGLWGYTIEYGDDTTAMYIKKAHEISDDPLKPLAGITVMLDPGHGGDDIGAFGVMGHTNSPNEKDINLALAKTIRYRLEQMGAEVILTRDEDVFLELSEILEQQYTHRPDFFISVHHDALDPYADLNDKSGVTGYYFNSGQMPNAPMLAQSLVNSIASETGRENRGARFGNFYVARATVCPSVLFEYGFVGNPSEFEDITSTTGMYAAACGTAAAIMEMLVANSAN